MRDHDREIDRAIALLREPVAMDHTLDARVMAEVARVPAPRRLGPVGRAGLWLVRPRPVRVPPVAMLAAAAALVVAVVRPWGGTANQPAPQAGAAAFTEAAGSLRPTRFMLVAPAASVVTLVGDFNDWSADSTPMTTDASEGLWTVTIPLEPGRYRYAFLVDGEIWTPDPGAPRAMDDDFGRPNSVLTIGGL